MIMDNRGQCKGTTLITMVESFERKPCDQAWNYTNFMIFRYHCTVTMSVRVVRPLEVPSSTVTQLDAYKCKVKQVFLAFILNYEISQSLFFYLSLSNCVKSSQGKSVSGTFKWINYLHFLSGYPTL